MLATLRTKGFKSVCKRSSQSHYGTCIPNQFSAVCVCLPTLYHSSGLVKKLFIKCGAVYLWRKGNIDMLQTHVTLVIWEPLCGNVTLAMFPLPFSSIKHVHFAALTDAQMYIFLQGLRSDGGLVPAGRPPPVGPRPRPRRRLEPGCPLWRQKCGAGAAGRRGNWATETSWPGADKHSHALLVIIEKRFFDTNHRYQFVLRQIWMFNVYLLHVKPSCSYSLFNSS